MASTLFSLPRLKFCGLRRLEDVRAAIECGADAIGLNFFEKSPRYIVPTMASELALVADGHAARVGVFVNATPAEVSRVLDQCPLDYIQLHGEESPQWLIDRNAFPKVAALPIIRSVAWRGTDEDRLNVESWCSAASHCKLPAFHLLVDAHDPIQRGGTGKTARWDLLNPRPVCFADTGYLLAGGITADNVTLALSTAQPDGIDLASGIESAPGIKDRSKMESIAIAVREYYAAQ